MPEHYKSYIWKKYDEQLRQPIDNPVGYTAEAVGVLSYEASLRGRARPTHDHVF